MSLSTDLRTLVAQSISSLSKMNEAEVIKKRSPDSWLKKEILGHLIDSAINNIRRVVVAGSQDHLIFDGYDQDLWVRANNYQEREWTDIIDTWTRYNHHFSQIICEIDEELLSRKSLLHNYHLIGFGKVESDEEVSLSQLIEDYIAHMRHHLNQILDSNE